MKWFKYILILVFAFNMFSLPLLEAQEVALPTPGLRVSLSSPTAAGPTLNPTVLTGIKIHPDNPLCLDFILNKGSEILTNDALKQESNTLIKYFLASLTIPEEDLWVNLSPYEKDRIVPESFGQTEMGRDLLAQDYMLKQITASLIYPEENFGKKFWKRIYAEAAQKFGTTNIPISTFNKVWIVPDKAVVYENIKVGAAYVVESKLKVMMEQDYLALNKNNVGVGSKPTLKRAGYEPAPTNINQLGSQIVRELVIPQLTKEINKGKNFTQLRQVYNSLILATWYKRKIKNSILNMAYANKYKTGSVTIDNPQEKKEIYERYLESFKKGAYNYIKEEQNPLTGQMIPRKYFSGGAAMGIVAQALATTNDAGFISSLPSGFKETVDLAASNANAAMTESQRQETTQLQELLKKLIFLKNKNIGVRLEGANGNERLNVSFSTKNDDDQPYLDLFDPVVFDFEANLQGEHITSIRFSGAWKNLVNGQASKIFSIILMWIFDTEFNKEKKMFPISLLEFSVKNGNLAVAQKIVQPYLRAAKRGINKKNRLPWKMLDVKKLRTTSIRNEAMISRSKEVNPAVGRFQRLLNELAENAPMLSAAGEIEFLTVTKFSENLPGQISPIEIGVDIAFSNTHIVNMVIGVDPKARAINLMTAYYFPAEEHIFRQHEWQIRALLLYGINRFLKQGFWTQEDLEHFNTVVLNEKDIVSLTKLLTQFLDSPAHATEQLSIQSTAGYVGDHPAFMFESSLKFIKWSKVKDMINSPVLPVSNAMVTAAKTDGGIDLNPAQIHLEDAKTGPGINLRVNQAMLSQLEHASGLIPTIVDLEFLSDVKAFLLK